MTHATHASTLIAAVQQADSPPQLIQAVQSLAAARLEAGISTLIAVLGYNNPIAALAAVEGLVGLGAAAVQPLIEQLDEYNYGARAYALRALAAIADPRALEVLLTAAATDFAPSVRRAAAQGLGNLRWSQMDAAQRSTAQAQAVETLRSIAQDADWSIRYAAIVGLQGLARLPDLQAQVWSELEQIAHAELDPVVQARVALAQQCSQAPAV
jgi:phycocyanobilin lyase beta subunit